MLRCNGEHDCEASTFLAEHIQSYCDSLAAQAALAQAALLGGGHTYELRPSTFKNSDPLACLHCTEHGACLEAGQAATQRVQRVDF